MASNEKQHNSQSEIQEKIQAAEYNKYGWCQIHEACYKGFMHAVRRIIENSFDKQQQIECFTRDELSVTPIVIATLGGHYELVQYLNEAGANLLVRNNKGHGVIEIAAIRQDFKMLNYLIGLNDQNLNPYIWSNLVKLICSSEDEDRYFNISASRCLEKLTEKAMYEQEDYTEEMWSNNCGKLIDNGIFKVVSRIYSDFAKDNVISALVILINLLDYSRHVDKKDTTILFFRQGGYLCLINFLETVRFKEIEIVCLFGRLLCTLGSTEHDAQAFLRREFAEMQEPFFCALISALRGIPDADNIYPYIDFFESILKHNKNIDVPFNVWKTLVNFIIKKCPHGSNEKLLTSVLRLICTLIDFMPVIQYQLIEEGMANFLNETLKQDNENLRVTSMETIKRLCLSRVEIQISLFESKTHDSLFSLLNKYHTKFLKKTTINAIWAIAGDDILQRQMVVNKMSLSLINECLSDNDNLNVIGCEALVVMLEQPPNCTQAAHETFLKFESVPRLCRILTTTNQSEANMLAALRCMKKLCAMCGDNAHKKAQIVVKNSEAMPLLISFLRTAKSELIKAESACALAYICLDNKDHIKLAIDEYQFTYNDIFNLFNRIKEERIKLLITKSLAIFAYNNAEQEKLIKSCGILDYDLFGEFIHSDNDMERCEAAYQTILLSGLIFGKEPSKLIMRGMRILIGYFEAKSTPINLRCFVAEKLVSLSRLKNGIAEALLDIEFVDILSKSIQSIKNDAFKGYVSIALSNLTAIPDGKRKLLKICRQDLSLIELLEFYNNYPESNHRLNSLFMKEWNHVKVYFENNKNYEGQLTNRSIPLTSR